MDQSDLADTPPLQFIAGVAQDLQIPDERAISLATNWVAGHCRSRIVEVRWQDVVLRWQDAVVIVHMCTFCSCEAVSADSCAHSTTCSASQHAYATTAPLLPVLLEQAYTAAKKGDDVASAQCLFQLANILAVLPIIEPGSGQVELISDELKGWADRDILLRLQEVLMQVLQQEPAQQKVVSGMLGLS